MIRLVFDRLGLRSQEDGGDVVVPGEQKLVVARDVGDYKLKVQDGPWPAFPADLTRSPSARDPGGGIRADPRVDVRESPGVH